MRRQANKQLPWTIALLGLAGVSVLGATGCQVDVNGQTLPAPYYMKDDVQYFSPGPKFKLQKEADAMREFNENQAQSQTRQ